MIRINHVMPDSQMGCSGQVTVTTRPVMSQTQKGTMINCAKPFFALKLWVLVPFRSRAVTTAPHALQTWTGCPFFIYCRGISFHGSRAPVLSVPSRPELLPTKARSRVPNWYLITVDHARGLRAG